MADILRAYLRFPDSLFGLEQWRGGGVWSEREKTVL